MEPCCYRRTFLVVVPCPFPARRPGSEKWKLCSVKELRWKRSLVRVWYETDLGRIETYHIMWYSLNATKTSHNWGWLEPFQPFIYSKFRDCLLGLPFTTLYWNHCIKSGQSLLSRHWGLKWKPGMAWHNSDGTFKVKCAESTLMTCFDVFWCELWSILMVNNH